MTPEPSALSGLLGFALLAIILIGLYHVERWAAAERARERGE